MTLTELRDYLCEYTPLESHLASMSKEEQVQDTLSVFRNYYPELPIRDPAEPEIGQFMLQYGVRGKDNYGPSPVLQTKPARKIIANNVYADSQGVGKWLVVQRHPRFQDFFEHSHSFVEINYVYSGSCRNIVNGNCISMQEGDFLVMAPGCRHKIEPLGENDLLINFLFLPIYAEVILDKVIPGKSRIAEFLVSSMYSAASKSNYVFFETHGNGDLSNIADDIMREYFDQDPETSEALIECLMHELFILLWRHNIRYPEKVTYAFQPNSTIAMIVNYIKENSVTCTRESTAKHFAYSPNHLSNLLIENIGKGFVQLRNEFRLDLAKRKLFSTGQSVRSIADECGFTNITQFYKLYKDTFGKLPREESQ